MKNWFAIFLILLASCSTKPEAYYTYTPAAPGEVPAYINILFSLDCFAALAMTCDAMVSK